MRAIDLDFQTQRMPAARLGYALACLGALLMLLVLGAQSKVSAEIERYRDMAPEPGHGADLTGLPRGNASGHDAVDGARAIVAHLSGPWDSLFQALEQISEPNVALLALTPDVQKRTIRIQAEAKNFDALVSYYRALERSPELRDVMLVEHEIRSAEPQRPVRFVLAAAWGGPG